MFFPLLSLSEMLILLLELKHNIFLKYAPEKAIYCIISFTQYFHNGKTSIEWGCEYIEVTLGSYLVMEQL